MMLRSLFGLWFCLGCVLALGIGAARAEGAKPVTMTETLEVTADQSLEWNQDQRTYVARGKAKAVRADKTIEADLLTAHQRDEASAKTGTEGGAIDRVVAEGHVEISDPQQRLFGDHAVYDVDRGVITVTGKNLKFQTATETVTARDVMDYNEKTGVATARGNAVGIHQKTPEDRRRVDADVLTAHFGKGADGAQELKQLNADGNVTIVTATSLSRGDKAVFDVKKNTAILTGQVKITQGNTQLAGDKAETDFTLGTSRLLNEGKGRVRALIPQRAAESQAGKGTGS